MTDGDVDNSMNSGEEEEEDSNSKEERMMLLPPPPSWFQLDNQYMAPVTGNGRKHDCHDDNSTTMGNETRRTIESTKSGRKDETAIYDTSIQQTDKSPSISRATVDSIESKNINATADSSIPTILQSNSFDNENINMFNLIHSSSTPPSQSTSLSTATTTLTKSLESILHHSTQTLSQTIPTLLHEYSSSAIQRSVHKLRLEYARLGPTKRYARASDIGNACGRGYYLPPSFRNEFFCNDVDGEDGGVVGAGVAGGVAARKNGRSRDVHLDWMWASDGTEVRFTTLPWIERQLVHEWRTYEWSSDADLNNTSSNIKRDSMQTQQQQQQSESEDSDEDEETYDMGSATEYDQARTLAPRPLPRPQWEKAPSCYTCRQLFGPTLHRHHCRRCGHSFCHAHSNYVHKLPHLGYDGDVPERVCKKCKSVLDARDIEERVTWRLARCRDFLEGNLTPYFETGVDTVEDAAYRLTQLAIRLARKIPLGAQAYVAIETVEVLRKHGLKGVYGLLLRKEFLAAADLLCRVLGINKKNWPLSVHELSAAIFYALAQHRALRGLRPDGEETIHSLMVERCDDVGGERCGKHEEDWVSRRDKLGQTKSYLGVVNEHPTKEEVEDDDEAGDTIVWEARSSQKKYLTGEFSESVLDETDVYDPTTEKVVDVLAMSASDRSTNASEDKRCKDDAIKSQGETPINANEYKSETTTNHQNHAPAAQTSSNLPFDPVCEHVPDSLLSSLLFYAPLALDFIYAECEVDMQLLAAQQGWRLIYASLDQNHHHHGAADGHARGPRDNGHGIEGDGNEQFSDKPASALFAHDGKRIACLSIRGTATIQDVVTDIRAMPVPFPQQEEEEDHDIRDDGGDGDLTDDLDSTAASQGDGRDDDDEEWTSVFRGNGLALCGMAGAASNIFGETADSLLYLALKGYRIRIVGHSLGGGVAALLGILMLRYFKKQSVKLLDDEFVRVYSYGTPSCVDAKLADHPLTLGLVTSVVLHDDVVPRLTPTSVRGLLKHLLYIRETWVKTHLSDDLSAITERAYKVWPTRLRGSFTLLKKKGVASAKRLKKSCKKKLTKSSSSASNLNSCTKDDGQTNCKRVTDENCDMNATFNDNEGYISDGDSNIGSDEGVDVEGDLFFDPLDDPLNESDDESSVGNQQCNESSEECDSGWVPFDEPPLDPNDSGSTNPSKKPKDDRTLPQINENQQASVEEDASPQILEELPLPRMFIPGRIVHVYTHQGGYKAAFVPRKFRSLRRISMAGNMLSDHMTKSYYEGLLEVKSIRAAKQALPPWVGFADDCTCACCASLFTWASTSNTEAQAARDKHNCRACGGLVCEPCSKKRLPIPAIGISAPVRVCDRCYNGWGALYGGDIDFGNDREKGEDGNASTETPSERGEKTVSASSRRSAVVDELASRIPSI
mmetsp:Transcript_23987/g.51859  ORF Transcript_23987/g.51859 Transcript_23987/m.51859 type:complete len:1409 (+) Transcript_23987:314-4540(+)